MKKLPIKQQNICGVYVRSARKTYSQHHRQKMTQDDLAQRLQSKGLSGFDRIAVCRLEQGKRQVSDVELKYLAAALEVSPIYLLYGNQTVLPDFNTINPIVAED